MDRHLFRLLASIALLAAALLPAPARGGDEIIPQQPPQPYAVETPASLTQPDRAVFDPGAGITSGKSTQAVIDGKVRTVRPQQSLHSGYFIPDGRGGYVWVGDANPIAPPSEAHEAAREIKLKTRELADQLLSDRGGLGLQSAVAIPVSFVSQDDFQQTSSFGRYLAEQMFYEFNQRGVPIREYRMDSMVSTRGADGDFLLNRRQQQMDVSSLGGLVLVGTYYHDRDNVFVNARLIRSSDGLVIRTGLLVFGQTEVSRRMLASHGHKLESTYVSMKDYTTMTRDASITPIDLGEDIH